MKYFQKIAVMVFLPIGLFIIKSCKELTPPVVTTFNISGVTQTTAVSGGNVEDDGGAAVTARGICWGINQNPTIASIKTSVGTGTGSFISYLTNLAPNITYYVRAYATNSEGTSYGNEISFITSPIVLATISTASINSVTTATAVCGGNITFDGGTVIIERGVCWSTNQNPTTDNDKTSDGSGTGSFTTNMKCLSFATTYYVRAYATNSAGTAYGEQLSFTTPGSNPIIFNPDLNYGTVTDIDGNCYKTIQIGTQTWMAENLKTTSYNDNTPIINSSDNVTWCNDTLGAYCWYNNDLTTFKDTYGALYNWSAVHKGKLCPIGWHVPLYSEWWILINLNESWFMAGRFLKESGTTHWLEPSEFATNHSGFTGLGGGCRRNNGDFYGINIIGMWWAATTVSEGEVCGLETFNDRSVFWGDCGEMQKGSGLSVRCLKN